VLVEALIKAIETTFAASAEEIAIVAHEVAAAASASIGRVGGCFGELLRSPASYDHNQGLWTLDNAATVAGGRGEGLAERVEQTEPLEQESRAGPPSKTWS